MADVQVAQISLVDGARRDAPVELGQASVRGGTLYILAEVSAPTEEWDDACKQIVERATNSFRASKQSETNALQAAAHSINSYLLDHNKELPRSDHIWAGFNAVFIKEEELYLAQAGPALTYIARGDSVTRFPKSFNELQTNRMEALTPLGERLEIRCRLAHFQLQTGDMVTLAASHLPTLGAESRVADAVRGSSPREVVAALHAIAKNNDFSALAIQYDEVPAVEVQKAAPPVAPSPGVAVDEWEEDEEWDEEPDGWDDVLEEDDAVADDGWEDEDGPEPAPLPPPKPVAVPASTPVRAKPVKPETTKRASAVPIPQPEPIRVPARATEEKPPRRAEPTPVAEVTSPAKNPTTRSAAPAPTPETVPGRARPTTNTPAPALARSRDTALTQAVLTRSDLVDDDGDDTEAPSSAGWQGVARKVGGVLLGALAALLGGVAAFLGWLHRTAAPRLAATGPLWDRAAHGLWGLLHKGWYLVMKVGRQVLPGEQNAPPRRDDAVPPPPGDGSGFLKIAVFVLPLLVLVVALTAGALLGGPEAAAEGAEANRYQTLTGQAQELIFQAGSVDETTAQRLVQQANELLNEAEPLEATEGEVGRVAALREQAQTLMNQASAAGGSPVTTLAALASGMEPLSLVEGGGSLFALEGSRDSVYRILTNAQGPAALAEIAPLLSAQQRTSDGTTVGTPQFIVWVPAGGGRTNNGLLTLTEQSLFDYDPAANVIRSVPFALVQGSEIRDAEGYGGNLYLLDRANQQVWKYVPNGLGQYGDAPQPWLTEAGQRQTSAPVDMAIDGYIYLLNENGEISRFQMGEQTSGFVLDPVTPSLTAPVAIAKAPPESTDMFVADAQRVLRFDPNGKFIAEYHSPMSTGWGTIRDIAVSENNETLYVLTNTGVYMMDVRNAAPAPAQAATPAAQPQATP